MKWKMRSDAICNKVIKLQNKQNIPVSITEGKQKLETVVWPTANASYRAQRHVTSPDPISYFEAEKN